MADEKINTNKIAIEWNIPEGVMTPFATNMVIQTIENEFRVYFFEVKTPVRLEKTDPPLNKVRADCVGSVIITADRMPNFIEVLQNQFDIYISKQQEKQRA
jgi:hypothetical protein